MLDCIITIDHRGRIIEFNPAAERTFRYKRSEVMGQEMAQLIIPPALRAAHREGLARYLAAGTGGAIDRRFETTAMRADGTEFPVELSLVRIPSSGPPMFTGFLRDITVQKRMLEQLSYRAAHDGLTQSLNRTAFMDRLRIAVNRAREGEPSIAVLFVDIDQFKTINDRYGHAVGDQLLVAMAGRLHGCVRPSDTVARLGGDEFAILIEDVTTHAEVATVAERIKQALGSPFNLDGISVVATASLGIAFGSSANRPEDLLHAADSRDVSREGNAGRDAIKGPRGPGGPRGPRGPEVQVRDVKNRVSRTCWSFWTLGPRTSDPGPISCVRTSDQKPRFCLTGSSVAAGGAGAGVLSVAAGAGG